MKNLFNLLLFICILPGFSQEKVFEIEKPFLDLRSYEKNTIKLTNQETNNIVFLLEEKKQIKALLIDQDYNLKKIITISKFPKKLNVLLGYNITDGRYHLFYSNTRFKKSAVLTLDFNNQTHHIKDVTYNIKGERFLDSFIHNNKVYLCTITNHSNTLNFYNINNAFELQKKKTVALNNVIYRSLNPAKDYYFLSDVFNGDYVNHHKILTHTKIDQISQHSLKEASKLIKFYPNKDHLFLTFDVDKTTTQVFEFNWDTFEGLSKIFPKPLMKNRSPFQRTNSFFFDDKLFQIVAHPKEIQLLIKDYTTNKTLKVYQATKKDSIDFKNSAIIVEEKNNISTKESKTSRFLRNISQRDLGIYAQKINDHYILTYGGVKIKENTSQANMNFNFLPIPYSSITISAPVFTFTDFSSFNYLNTTYIKSVFSSNFEHENIPVPQNSQDKLLVYNKKEVKQLPAKVIFEHNNSIHFGYYDFYRKKFILFRF